MFPDLNSVSQERCSLSVESSVALTPQGHMGESSKTAAQSQVLVVVPNSNEHSKEQVNSSKADSASRSGSAKGKAVQYSAKVKCKKRGQRQGRKRVFRQGPSITSTADSQKNAVSSEVVYGWHAVGDTNQNQQAKTTR